MLHSVLYSTRAGIVPDLILTLCNKVCQWLATGRWFSPGTPVSSTNKTDRHDITEILLKVALNTIKQTNYQNVFIDIKTRISSYWINLITDCQQLFMFCLTHKKLISCSFQFLFFFSCITEMHKYLNKHRHRCISTLINIDTEMHKYLNKHRHRDAQVP
jgi:hypothetical protein